ncbi:MAG: S-adenosylmethionine decarboxylase [Arenicella sp.]|jgi:S-adenosylmethionine decarboxylase
MTSNNHALMGRHAIIEHTGRISAYSSEQLDTLLSAAALAAKATILNKEFHAFGEGMGVTGVLMLAESHISVHTWPERNRYSAIDIFVCSDNDGLSAAIDVIRAEDPKGKMSVKVINRLVPQINQPIKKEIECV